MWTCQEQFKNLNNFRHEIWKLEPVILRSVMGNAITIASLCEAENGDYLKNIKFHKINVTKISR